MTRRAALSVLGAVLALVPIVGPTPAAAGPGDRQRTWAVEDSLEVQSRIEEAERLLDRGLDGKALDLFQEILDRFPDHLVRDPSDPVRYVGARRYVLDRLGLLPETVRATYTARHGNTARDLLERGLRLRDAAVLGEVADRFLFAGDAAPRALLALADLHRVRGEPWRTLGPLRTLLREFAGTPWAGSPTVARLARALADVGDHDALVTLRAELGAAAAVEVTDGDGTAALGDFVDAAIRRAGEADDGPALLGGGPDRSARGEGIAELGALRWSKLNPQFRWTRHDFKQRQMESSVDRALDVAEPVVPAVADGRVFFHWNFDLRARDLYTGDDLWHFRTTPIPKAEAARTHGSLLMSPAVADGTVYANLQVWPAGESLRVETFAGQEIIPYLPVRRLFAVDADTGLEVWSHRSPVEGSPFAGRLARLNVTSSPLIVGDLVIAAGAAYRGQFTAWAFAADRHTGEVRWMTRLAYGQQELNLFGRPVKEIPVAAVASDGERCWVQTNLGVVSCLETATGRTLWARGYDQVEIPLYENFWSTPERALTWTGATPVFAGGRVFVAPADGTDLMALDAETGALEWSEAARAGSGVLGYETDRLLGADATRLYLGGSVIRALRHSGPGQRIVWQHRFELRREGERTAGRGVIAGDRLIVPSTHFLYQFDAASGRVVRKDPWVDREGDLRPVRLGTTGGNLVVADGAAVVSRLYQMEGYFSPEDVRARVMARLRRNPQDPEALVEAARVLLAAGRVDEAVPILDRAVAASAALPADRRARSERTARELLFRVLMERARELERGRDTPGAATAFIEAADRAPDPERAVEALFEAQSRWLVARQPEQAYAVLERMIERYGDTQLPDSGLEPTTAGSFALHLIAAIAGQLGQRERALAARQRILEERPASDLLFGEPAHAHARRAIDELIAEHGRAAYAALDAAAEAARAAASATGDPDALAAVERRWPNSLAAPHAALEEARLRLAAGDATGALAAARRALAGHLDDDDRGRALWTVAEGLARTGKVASARSALERLAREHPDLPVSFEGGDRRAADAVAVRLASPALAPRVIERSPLPREPGWTTLWSRDFRPEATIVPIRPVGEPLAAGVVVVESAGDLMGLDPRTGAVRWTRELDLTGASAASAAQHLVLAGAGRAVGIDPATGDALWDRELDGIVSDLAVADGLVVALLVDPEDLQNAELTALDPATGQIAWSRPQGPVGGAESIAGRTDSILVETDREDRTFVRVLEAPDGQPRGFLIPTRRPTERRAGHLVPMLDGPLVVYRRTGLEAFDPHEGALLWRLDFASSRLTAGAAVEGRTLALVDRQERIEAIDLDTGTVLWSRGIRPGRRLLAERTTVLVDADAVFTASIDREAREDVRVEAWDRQTGEPLWDAAVSRLPAFLEFEHAGGALLVRFLTPGRGNDGETGLLVFDPRTGRVLDRFVDDRLAGEPFSTTVVEGVLLVHNDRTLVVRGR